MKGLRVYVGVDPGSKGAICFYCPETMQVEFVDLSEPVPVLIEQMREVMTQVFDHTAVMSAMIEKVASLPRVSAKSNFSFGYNLGSITTLLTALGMPLDQVPPKKWQGFLGIKPKSNTIKKDVAAKVLQLIPTLDIYGPRGGLIDGRSDAFAIAHYHYKTS